VIAIVRTDVEWNCAIVLEIAITAAGPHARGDHGPRAA